MSSNTPPRRPQHEASHAEQQQQQQVAAMAVDPTCQPGASWTDFASSWNAFGNTATGWWESAAASWQPTSAPDSPSSFFSAFSSLEDGADELARMKRTANRQQHPYHQDATSAAYRSQMVRKELSRLSSNTLSSNASSGDDSSFMDESSIWDSRHGHRIHTPKHTNAVGAFASVGGEGEQVDDHHQHSTLKKPSCCQAFRERPLKYKLIVFGLVVSILACAVVVALASVDVHSKKETTSQNSADVPPDEESNGKSIATDTPVTTNTPTEAPTTPAPTTSAPTVATMAPTEEEYITYLPGKLTTRSNGLLLSEGLRSRIIARSGEPVTLNGLPPLQTSSSSMEPKQTQSPPTYYKSLQNFHQEPDGAAVFEWAETGGWVYVSNSEVKEEGRGGVGAIYFDANGQVMDYQTLLDGTTMNCGGGPTPWGTWVSCEEIDGGRAYQVDPFGIRPPEPLSIVDTGLFEAFAHDIRNPQQPAFYITEDKERGPLRRMVPTNPDWEDPWEILHGMGTLEYLVLEPNANDNDNSGTYYWTQEKEVAKVNSQRHYRFSEGIDVHNDQLFFVSKEQKELFILNLDDMTYEKHTTVSGVFDGHPDQMKRLIQNGLLYFCEEGGKQNGVHARDENGWFFTILESDTLSDETTGLAFSPNGKHMYVSYQHNGLIFDVWREDGLPFHGRTLNVKYHQIHRT